MNALYSFTNLLLLALDSQQVVQLRLFRLGQGGPLAIDESMLMVSEKIEAFREAAGIMMLGGSFDSTIASCHSIVQANIQRLSSDG